MKSSRSATPTKLLVASEVVAVEFAYRDEEVEDKLGARVTAAADPVDQPADLGCAPEPRSDPRGPLQRHDHDERGDHVAARSSRRRARRRADNPGRNEGE
jgi:hypothetical protein